MNSNQNFVNADTFVTARDDAAMIQAALDMAEQQGVPAVVVPSFNPRTKQRLWEIGSTILLPSNCTLYLENAHLRMADGAVCQMFANRNSTSPLSNKPEGQQQGIRIIGRGTALLDGGEPNGLSEHTSLKDGRPHISENLTIYLHNVTDFEIANLRIVNQRWWAIAMTYSSYGKIENIHFALTRHAIDTNLPWRNQDGINLRAGCHNIVIRSISGEVGDDMIALTALNGEGLEQLRRVEGALPHIHDVLVEDVRGVTNACSLIRLLNHFGQKIYNVTMHDIVDTSRSGIEALPRMAIRIGDAGPLYHRHSTENRVKHGEVFNIHIENVYTRALSAFGVCTTIRDMTARNIHLLGEGHCLFVAGGFQASMYPFIYTPSRQADMEQFCLVTTDEPPTILENLLCENLFASAGEKVSGDNQAVFRFNNVECKQVEFRNVVNRTGRPLVSFLGKCNGKIQGLETC